MTTYRYLDADAWGMVWARPPVGEHLLDPEVFVHHSAGSTFGPDAAHAFRTLNRYAIEHKGYSAVDYDVLVHYDPVGDVCTIGEGRGPHRSAATADRNEEGEAVCVLGYFHPGHSLSRRPYPAEVEGTARAIVWAIERGWVARDATILGHRDNPARPGATGCPGDYMQAELPTIRARVAELLTPTTEDPMPEYIVKPTAKFPGSPWFYCRGADVRYALAQDVAEVRARLGADAVVTAENDLQYAWLYRQVFGVAPT